MPDCGKRHKNNKKGLIGGNRSGQQQRKTSEEIMQKKHEQVKPLLPLTKREMTALRNRLDNNPGANVDAQIVARLMITAEANSFLAGVLMYRQRRRAEARAKVRRVLQ